MEADARRTRTDDDRLARRWLVALLAIVLLANLPGFGWGLPHTFAPHVDDAAKPALTAMQERFLGVTKYPKVHLLTLAAAYTPYLGWLWFSGGLELGQAGAADADASALADPVGSMQVLLLIARAVSLLMHLGSVALLFVLVRRLTGRAALAALAGGLFGLAPMLAYLARTSRVDVPMCFWLVATGLAALTVLEQRARRGLLAFGLLSIVAVCTKEQATFLLAPLALLVGAVALRAGRWRALTVAVAAGLLVYALLNDLLWSPSTYVQRLALWRADLGSFEQGVARSPGALALTGQALAAFVDSGGHGLALLTALAALRALLRPERRGLVLVSLLVACPALTCAALGFVQPRYLAPALLVAAVLVAQQLGALLAAAGGRPRRVVVLLASACVLWSLAQTALVSWAFCVDSLGLAAQHLAQALPRASVVEIYQNENVLPGLRALGLEPRRERRFERAAFEARRPATVVVGDHSRWVWDAAQRAYVAWLMDGPPGYTVTRFGSSQTPCPSRWLPPILASHITPDMVVLQRID